MRRADRNCTCSALGAGSAACLCAPSSFVSSSLSWGALPTEAQLHQNSSLSDAPAGLGLFFLEVRAWSPCLLSQPLSTSQPGSFAGSLGHVPHGSGGCGCSPVPTPVYLSVCAVRLLTLVSSCLEDDDWASPLPGSSTLFTHLKAQGHLRRKIRGYDGDMFSQPASLHQWPLSPREAARDGQNHRFGAVLPHTQLSNRPLGQKKP